MKPKISSVPITINRFRTFNEEFRSVYDDIIEILGPYKKLLNVKVNDGRTYELWTEKEFRTNSFHPRRQQGIPFVGVIIWKNFVSLYFHPLNFNEHLKDDFSEALHGIYKSSCVFRITHLSETLKKDISDLLERGYRFYETEGYVRTRR